MAEDLIELGLEGFDRAVDKYHDKAYDTATDRAGKVWKKVHLPGRRKSVYVEQNPQHGQQAEVYDPSKDERPDGFKKDQNSDQGDDRGSRRDDRSQNNDDRGYDRGRRDDTREAGAGDERGYYGNDNLDSPRKVRINPFTEVRMSRPYPNEMPRDTYGGYPPPPPQPGTYFPQRQDAPVDGYRSPPQARYNDPGQYYGPAAAGVVIGRDQQQPYRPQDRAFPRDESPNQLGRYRSYDPRRRSGERDPEFSPPRNRRARSAAARDRYQDRDRDRDPDRRKSRDFSLGASLAGAVVGGLAGRSLGKGDLVTTVAGGVVGALGGDILADKKERGDKRDRRDDRDKYNRERYNSRGEKDYNRDYTYKDRY